MQCPRCGSEQLSKNGVRQLQSGDSVQYDLCKACQKRFNERPCIGSEPRLRWSRWHSKPAGLRATSRVVGKAHDSVRIWEARLAAQTE